MGVIPASEETMSYYDYDKFMTVSQFKAYKECSAKAKAKQDGLWKDEFTDAMLVGSYVDVFLTGTTEEYIEFEHTYSDRIIKRDKKPYAYITKADDAIKHLQKQPLAMKYLDGEHQAVMYGQIEGVPFKIKMDAYKPGEYITDLKYLASLRSPNLFQNVIKYWGYDIQAACYQEIVRQNTGEKLPFYFVIATKEDPPKVVVAEIKQHNMDEALEEVKRNIKKFYAIKMGELPPENCGECDYCVETMIQTEIIDTDMLGVSKKQRDYMKEKGL